MVLMSTCNNVLQDSQQILPALAISLSKGMLVSSEKLNTNSSDVQSTREKMVNYFGSIRHQFLQNLEPLVDPFPSSLQSKEQNAESIIMSRLER